MKQSLKLWIGAILSMVAISGCETQSVQPEKGYRYVSAEVLNLRSCPGPECHIIGKLNRGDKGVVIREQLGWVNIQIVGKSKSGWVAGRYLSNSPVSKRQAKKQSTKKAVNQPKIPEEGYAAPVYAPPAPSEELATPEQSSEPAPLMSIEEEFAK